MSAWEPRVWRCVEETALGGVYSRRCEDDVCLRATEWQLSSPIIPTLTTHIYNKGTTAVASVVPCKGLSVGQDYSCGSRVRMR